MNAKCAFAHGKWRLRIFWKARSEVADTRDAPVAECQDLGGFCHADMRVNKRKSTSRPCQDPGRVECLISQRWWLLWA